MTNGESPRLENIFQYETEKLCFYFVSLYQISSWKHLETTEI